MANAPVASLAAAAAAGRAASRSNNQGLLEALMLEPFASLHKFAGPVVSELVHAGHAGSRRLACICWRVAGFM